MRYLQKLLVQDLQKKMVFLSGARQVGKTTLAKEIVSKTHGTFLNWDIAADRKVIFKQAWDKQSSLIALDEIHKAPKWKNFLKGVYDDLGGKQKILVTGSARLDTFRKSGDALTGRYYHYHLHPIDIVEGFYLQPNLEAKSMVDHLKNHGGFPESFFNPQDSQRLGQQRLEQVVREDIRDLSRIGSIRSVELLIDLLRERVGGAVSYQNLAKDLSISSPTIKSWIDLLEKLYVIFLVPPFTFGSKKSIRKEHRVYFFDSSLGENGDGFRLENVVASTLLKYCDLQHDKYGIPLRLFYYRDQNKHDVDFIVAEKRKVHWIIEVKTSRDQFSPSLFYLKQKHPKATVVQLVTDLTKTQEQDGVRMENVTDWILKNVRYDF